MSSKKGFTLLELIIALAIFAIVGIMAMGGLQYLLSVRDKAQPSRVHLEAVNKAHLYLSRDLQQVVNRPIRNEYSERESAFIGRSNFTLPSLLVDEQLVVSLTRWSSGAISVGPYPVDMVRVDYVLRGGELIRRLWPVLDRVAATQAEEEVLLTGLLGLQVTYIDSSAVEVRDWYLNIPDGATVDPVTGAQGQVDFPRAVRMDLNVEERVYDWLFSVG